MIEPGQKAPAFHLADQNGEKHRLSDYAGQWVVLYFYPKDNTPGCTKQACQFRDAHKKLEKLGAVVLGVSPDDEKSHRRFAEKQKLNFTLLADPDKKTCTKYGVWQEKRNFGVKYMGVVRTTYLINPTGKVVQRFDKVRVADQDKTVFEALNMAQQEA